MRVRVLCLVDIVNVQEYVRSVNNKFYEMFSRLRLHHTKVFGANS